MVFRGLFEPCALCNYIGHAEPYCDGPLLPHFKQELNAFVRRLAMRNYPGMSSMDCFRCIRNYLIAKLREKPINEKLIMAFGMRYCRLGQYIDVMEYVDKIANAIVAELIDMGGLLPADSQCFAFVIAVVPVPSETRCCSQECNICLESKRANSFVKTNCNHELCNDCFIKTMRAEQRNQLGCPYCRGNITKIQVDSDLMRSEITAYSPPNARPRDSIFE